MKSIGLTFLIASWLSIATSGAATPPPVRIMPLGDSLTSGYSTPTYLSGYRSQLYSLLAGAGYNVDYVGTQIDTQNPAIQDPNHEGHGGYRIDEIDTGIAGWLSAVDDPDVILLLIGTNDIWQNYYTADAPSRLENLIARIASMRPYAKIILANLPLRTDSASMEAAQVAYNATIPGIVSNQVALGHHVSFVDMHSSFTSSGLSSDGVHPNQAGYDLMAATWMPAITNVISPLGTADPPAMVRVHAIDFLHCAVTFSKPVEDAAANVANFNLSGGATISQASLDTVSKRIITLTTSLLTAQKTYTLTASGVRDRTQTHNQIAGGSTVAFTADRLINGSFESADFAGWAESGNLGISTGNAYPTTDGTNVLVFNNGQSTPNGVVSQSFATTSGQTYKLQFDVGAYAYSTSEQRLAVTVQGSGSLVSNTVSVFGLGGGSSAWVAQSYTFVANSATTTLIFQDVSPTSLNLDMLLDHVRVSAASPSNAAPVFTANPITRAGATQNVAYSGSLAGSASDANTGDPIAYSKTAGPAWLLVANDGTLSGTPGSSNVGANSFTVRVTDEAGAFNQAVLNIAVANVNDAPVANAQSASVNVNGTVDITLTGSDIDGDSLTFAVATAPAHGIVSLSGAVATYTANPNYSGPDSFTFTAYDGALTSAPATVSITTERLINGSFELSDYTGWTASGNQWIEINSSYYPATDGTNVLVFNEGQSTPNGVVSQNFATTVGNTYLLQFDMGVFAFSTSEQRLSVTVQGSGALVSDTVSLFGLGGGAVSWVAKSYTFVANSTTTTLTFRDVSPTSLNLDMLLDHVRVSAASSSNTAPVFSANPIAGGGATQGVAYSGTLAGSASDADAGDQIAYSKVAGPTWLLVANDGRLSGTPGISDVGTNTFTVRVTDVAGAYNQATLNIAVANSSLAGAAAKLAFTTQPGGGTGGTAWATQPVVTVQDANGNTVTTDTSTVTVGILIDAGPGGMLSGTLTKAAVAGVATFSALSIDKIGSGYTLAATDGYLSGATSNGFNITTGAASAAYSTLSASPGSLAADGSTTSTLTVTAKDAGNNAIAGASVILSATGTANTLVQPGVTDGNGQTNGALASSKAEAKTVSATVNGTLITPTAAVAFTAGAANKLAFITQPVNTPAGSTMASVVVQLQDANGNPVAQSGTAVILTVNGSTLYSGTNPQSTDVSGKATFNNLVIRQAGSGLTLGAAGSGLTGTTSGSFNIAALAAFATSVETAPDGSGSNVGARNVPAGNSITIYAITRDTYGNLVANPSATWSLQSLTGGVVSGDLVAGGASAVFTGHLAGTTIIRAAASTFTGNTGTQTVVAGAVDATHSTISPATVSITANGTSSQAITVQARDANNNNRTTGSDAVVFALAGAGRISGTTDNGNGSYTATVTSPTTQGTGTVTATLGGTAVGTAVASSSSEISYSLGVTSIATANSTTPGTGLELTVPASGVPLGNTVILSFAMDPVSGTVSATDTQGNTYSVDKDNMIGTSGSGTGVRTVIMSAHVTTALISGNTITIYHPTVTSRAASACFASGLVTASRVDQTASGGSSSAGTAPVTASTTTLYADELLIGAIGIENRSTTFTAGTLYTALSSAVADTTTAATSIAIMPEYRIVSATAGYTASGTIPSSRWAANLVTYRTTGISTATAIGTNTSTTSGTTITASVPAGGVAVHNTVLVTVAMDPSTATVVVTDARGNIYANDADVTNGSATTGVRTLICSAHVTTALVSADLITVTFGSAVVSKAISASYIGGLVMASRVDQTAATTGTSAAPSSGNTATTSQPQELVIGAIGVQETSTTATTLSAPGSGYTALAGAGTASTTGIRILPEYKIVRAATAYAGNGTLSATKLWSAAVVTYKTLGGVAASHSTIGPFTATKPADGTSTQVVTIQARDAYNNNITIGGEAAKLYLNSGTGILGATTDNGNGTYTATLTAPTVPGSGTVTATINGIPVGTAVAADSSVVTYAAGQIDHFAISTIDSPQTVGTAITGITLTARDANGYQASSFTGTVTFGGTAGVTGTSAAFSSGVLSGVSVTPKTAGSAMTVTVTDGANHAGSTTLAVINKATPTITTAPAAAHIVYGQTLASSTLTGGAGSVAGSFAFTQPDKAPGAGSASHDITFTPADTANYNIITLSVNVTVAQATPSVTIPPTAADIVYGQTLVSATLTGGAGSVAGSFAFAPPGTVPIAGTASHGVTFTPADTANYNIITLSVDVTVAKATPSITTPPNASDIVYGQTLASSTLIGGVGSVAGSFAFTTQGTVPGVGKTTQSVTFTPTDMGNYHSATLTVNVMVSNNVNAPINGSFETGDLVSPTPANPFNHYELKYWTVTGTPAGFQADLPNVPTTDGSRMAVFNGNNDTFGGTISQTITTNPGTTYQLKFDTGIIAVDASRQQLLRVALTGDSLLSEDVLLTTTSGGSAQWTAKTLVFTATGTMSTLTFTDKSGTLAAGMADACDLYLDHVRIEEYNQPNTPPVADAQVVTMMENTTANITLTGSDIDGDNSLMYAVAHSPSHGTLSVTGQLASYTPQLNYRGPDSFTFTVNDGTVNSASATVTITVNAQHAFTRWLAAYGLVAGPGDDSDGDSISNAIEYVIGGKPVNQPDEALLPTAALVTTDPLGGSTNNDYLLFTYRRTVMAKTDPSTIIHVEWTTDPRGPWTQTNGTSGVVTVEDLGADGDAVDLVKVYIPRSLSSTGKLFARLGVSVSTP